MIECVTLASNHLFAGNPISDQHVLRFQSIIARQGWDVPTIGNMEYDAYDNPAAYYLVKRNELGAAIGSSRLYPTDRPYMLSDAFAHLVTKTDLPHTNKVWEGSRFCVDKNLPALDRQRIVKELVVGYLEFGLARGVESIIGVMFPVYWKNIFIKSGWNVRWLGDTALTAEGHKIIAGELSITPQVLEHVRSITGITDPVLFDGRKPIMRAA